MWYRFKYQPGNSSAGLEDEVICPVCGHKGVKLQTQNSASDGGPARPDEPDRAVCPNCGTAFDHKVLIEKVRETAVETN